MNILDKSIAFFSPQTALKRETARIRLELVQNITNSGYSESGGSKKKKSLKGWNHKSNSPQEDIDENLHTLRQRSRSLWMGAPYAASAIKTQRTNVIGAGLKLKCRIDTERLGLTREQADTWEKHVEKEFALWADEKWCDVARLNNFYEIQQLALMSWLMNGDGWAAVKYGEKTKWMPYTLKLHMFEADRVSTPNNSANKVSWLKTTNTMGKAPNGNYIYNGVEVDKNGGVVAYWICNQYPQHNGTSTTIIKEWKRVEAYGPRTGNPNIIQLMESERCEQYRGVPYLAPVIEAMKQITRYTEAELTAAVVTAFFTVFITTDNSNRNEIPFTDSFSEEQQVDAQDENSYELGAGTVNVLGENEKVEIADPKRPASGFDPFVNAMAKQVGAALEIPYELLAKSFTSSYSASRAALLEAWKAFKMRRTWFANDFCQPVYKLWLAEAISTGRVTAPGYFNDPATAKAWNNAEWIGPAQGMLDPVKEVNAAIRRADRGFSTNERETYELTGGNWDENIEQITRENKKLRQANPAIGGGNNQ